MQGDHFMDYLLPTAMETPRWELDRTVTLAAPPAERQGRGEVSDGGRAPAIASAVVDALSHLGVTHIDIPITPEKGGPSCTRRGWRSRGSDNVDWKAGPPLKPVGSIPAPILPRPESARHKSGCSWANVAIR